MLNQGLRSLSSFHDYTDSTAEMFYSYLLCWCVSTHRESDLKGPRHTRLLRGAAHQPSIHYLPTVNICILSQGYKCSKLTFAMQISQTCTQYMFDTVLFASVVPTAATQYMLSFHNI